jgi:hypothetical protein
MRTLKLKIGSYLMLGGWIAAVAFCLSSLNLNVTRTAAGSKGRQEDQAALARLRHLGPDPATDPFTTNRLSGPIRRAGKSTMTAPQILSVAPMAAPTDAPPPLRLLLTDQANLTLPAMVGPPTYDGMDTAGNYVFVGSSSALLLRRAGSGSLERLLQLGDLVPGIPNATCDSFGASRTSPHGVLAVQVEYMDGGATKSIILKRDEQGWQKIVASPDEAPNSGGSIYGRPLTLIGVNDVGDIAFSAPLTALGAPSSVPVHTALFIAHADGKVDRIAGQGDTAPGTNNATLDGILGVGFNNSRAEVLFRATLISGSGATFG